MFPKFQSHPNLLTLLKKTASLISRHSIIVKQRIGNKETKKKALFSSIIYRDQVFIGKFPKKRRVYDGINEI